MSSPPTHVAQEGSLPQPLAAGQILGRHDRVRLLSMDGAWWLEVVHGRAELNGDRVDRLTPVSVGDQFEVDGERYFLMGPPTARERIVIGRARDADLVLDSPMVSAYHAELLRTESGYRLKDLGSSNGIFVDGQRVDEARLGPGQQVYIGPCRLTFDGHTLREFDERGQVKIDVIDVVFHPPTASRPILNHITLPLRPREFVALVGTSGAGKSTLLKCMIGQRAPTSGQVLYNGLPAEAFRHLLGYVPQDDIVHRELTVEAALLYAARLRLPPDTRPTEVARRIDFVLASVDLAHRRTTRIANLSGGERKRVSVAVELLTEPGVFFLDEPTSGLDPGLEKKAMQLYAQLARQGRTIVLITHATQNIVLCDKVAFLAPGGRLVYYGPPREALEFFQVEDFADIYLKLLSPQAGVEWEQRFRQSRLYAIYVASAAPTQLQAPPVRTTRSRRHPFKTLATGIRQLTVLVERYTNLLLSDRTNLTLLLGQAPLIALILAFLFPADLFRLNQEVTGEGKFPIVDGPTVMFTMMVSCILFGVINACREVVKERSILERERLVNLQLPPYLLSKVLLLGVLGMIQALILQLIVTSRIQMSLSLREQLELYGFLAGACLGGVLMGLLLSCLAQSTEQAMSLVSVILILQIVLSGAFVKPEGMTGLIAFLSVLSISRWVFAGLGHLLNLNNRFMELGMGWITSDFYLSAGQVWSVLGPLLTIYLAACWVALRWRESSSS